MSIKVFPFPVSHLRTNLLTASAKLLLMILQRDAYMEPHQLLSPTRLKRCSGLSRPTIRKLLAQLQAQGWYAPPVLGNQGTLPRWYGDTVNIPGDLATDTNLTPQARVMYGILKDTLGYRGQTRQFTYASMAQRTKLSCKTVKRAVRALVQASWLKITQDNKLKPIHFWFREPITPIKSQILQAQRRLEAAEFLGEALVGEYLRLLVGPLHFIQGGYDSRLENPKTGLSMQYDFYFPTHDVAVETFYVKLKNEMQLSRCKMNILGRVA